MKMMKKIFLLFVMAMMLCACSGGKKEEETPENKFDIAGRTYYNTIDDYGNENHSKVWFGKDGTFVFTDNFFNGSYDITGEWSLSENVVTLNVKESSVGQYSKILFELQDEDTMTLKTSLEGSKDGATFSTTEVKGSTGHGQIANSDFTYTTYYNLSQTSTNKSSFEVRSDNSCTMIDMEDFGVMEANGTYEIENGYMIVMKNFEGTPFGENVKAIEFQIYDENTLILMTDLGVSMTGDVFSANGSIPEALQVPMGDNLGNKGSSWRYITDTDVAEQYLPKVVFDTAGAFTFTENVYSGMAQIKGWYEKKSDGYICHVDDNSQMEGYTGADVKLIEFEKKDNSTLVLKTDICMSRAGDTFELID
ncbi:MAG: hypothetical protein IJU42_03595 [Erysipelotrichaceae bacterium]|nr:hypothetical protein [Erysipelotrichaceae bacterium]